MTTIHYLKMIALIVLAYVMVYAVQIPVRKKEHKVLSVLLWAVKWVLIIWFAYLLIAYASPFMWHFGYVAAALYLALLGDVVSDAAGVFLRRRVRRENQKYITAFMTLAVSLYAIVNMYIIVPTYHTYTSEKMNHTYKAAFIADLHYGSSQRPRTVTKALNKIREEHPDYLLLGGDIVDEHTTKEEMQAIFAELGNLGIPAYYIYGNHDRQDRGDYLGGCRYTEQELEDAITGNGITILYNDWMQVEDDLVFLGMEDPSRPDQRIRVSDLKPRPDEAFVLCLEHTPYQNDDIKEMKADLQLSGHTHAGQLFPLRWVYALIGLNVYGDYTIGDTQLYVTSGITGWYLPLRNEAYCSYEVITLQPE